MPDKFLENIIELKNKNETFATATVVWREGPCSSKVGDKAVINKFGEIIGWVGGGCVKGIVIKEAEDAMKTRQARLVKIGKSLKPLKEKGVMQYNMTCQSEGTVEIFIEPVLSQPQLIVMGKSAVARSLVKLASSVGYSVTAVAEDVSDQTFEEANHVITQIDLTNVDTTNASFIVVATQGEQDEKALEEAIKKDKLYLGFVSSRKKMVSISKHLEEAGYDKRIIDDIHSPAGIDINAKTPDEISVSILAEMIQVRNNSSVTFQKFEEPKASPLPKFYINPVCGVPVEINNPKHILEYKGENVYFCCDGCKEKFEADPGKYMNKVDSDKIIF